jgi:dsDNA-specific endonuclease/ATPase MutS2
MFSIGDKVSVLNENWIGKIIHLNTINAVIIDEFGLEYTFPLSELIPNKKNDLDNITTIPVKDKKTKKNNPLLKPKPTVLEVDLHLHEITDRDFNQTNFEKLTIQLNHVKSKINYAKKNNIQKIVFIHGIGTGKLKEELLHLLKQYNCTINDASYQKYGKGAIEVYFYRK